jgi:hypothetical protein
MTDYTPLRVTMNNTTVSLATFRRIAEICEKTGKPRGVVLDAALRLLYPRFEQEGTLPAELLTEAPQAAQ